MDQFNVLFAKLDEVYVAFAGLVNVVAGAVMVVVLAMAVYRYVAGNHKLVSLYEEALSAASAGLSLGLAAGILNGSLFPANAVMPYQLLGVLLTLVALKHLRK